LQTHDAIIIGGGHNGLACAAYLARAGMDVLVLERKNVLGGASVTEERWPGYHISSAAYVVSLMPPQVVRELELERFGYRATILDPDYWAPFPDGTSLTLWGDLQKATEEIAKFSKKDAAAYLEFDKYFSRLGSRPTSRCETLRGCSRSLPSFAIGALGTSPRSFGSSRSAVGNSWTSGSRTRG
jgi:phytoene dehydrogenase-like protein